jgi:hypothetical protein
MIAAALVTSGHSTAVAPPSEAQQHHSIGTDLLNRHHALVLGKLRIHLVVDHPAHALHQGGGLIGSLALDLRGLDVQLGPGALGHEIDVRPVQPGDAVRIDVQSETVAIDRPLVAGEVAGLCKLQPCVGANGAWIDGTEANAEARKVLAFDQAPEMRLGAVGDLDHAAILATWPFGVHSLPSRPE